MMKNTPAVASPAIATRIKKSQTRFKRINDPEGRDRGAGEFFLLLDITAKHETIYIPISIASGKKPTGFVYQIEGTAPGEIETTEIKVEGAGITQITAGTILYAKIPKGSTATFRILVKMRGKLHKTYRIIIDRINYKFDPNDARYQRYDEAGTSKQLTFT